MTTDITYYFAEYRGPDGKRHYGINRYNRVTGLIEYPTDTFFMI